jgi:hypothetical protein
MTVLESYQWVQNRLNRLSTNYGDNIPKYQFVEAFNTAQLMWLKDMFKLDETNTLRIDAIQQLLKTETLSNPVQFTQYYELTLPEDYLRYKRSISKAPCEIYNHLKKEGDINVLLNDEFWKPSLAWQETICTIVGNKLRVYVDDFSISEVSLVYFRKPIQVGLDTGFPDINGTPTQNVDPEFQDHSLIDILNLTCKIISGDTSDQFNFQVASQI